MNAIPYQGVALVTGASSGIGAIYADRLARRGYDLILVARNSERLTLLAERLTRETGRVVSIFPADLGNSADLARVEARLREDPSITMLVNNAGLGAIDPLLESDVERMTQIVALNSIAPMRLTYAAAPGFVARGSGAIVNIASVVAIQPELLNGVYGASKAFLLALTQSLQHELVQHGLRIQAVLPGATATEFWDVSGGSLEHLPSEIVMSAEALVDAALVGFDQGEVVTIPALEDETQWDAYEGARQAMAGRLSRATPADRYRRPVEELPDAA
jgi:short-subunit dehydrogenase